MSQGVSVDREALLRRLPRQTNSPNLAAEAATAAIDAKRQEPCSTS
jgi:hypothetical protein